MKRHEGTAGPALYSPTQIAVAAFIGAPLAAGVLVAANYRAVGAPHAARWAMASGVVGTLAAFASACAIPSDLPRTPVAIAWTLVVWLAAHEAQRHMYDDQTARRFQRQSIWRAMAVGILSLAGLAMVVAGALTLLPSESTPPGRS